MTKEELKDRTKEFAIRVFKLVNTLPGSKATDVVSHQLLKAAASVAANYRVVCRGKSEADFLDKLKVVDEEADKSLFWLDFIKDVGLECDLVELVYLIKEADELVSIFSTSIKTMKARNNKILN